MFVISISEQMYLLTGFDFEVFEQLYYYSSQIEGITDWAKTLA